MNRVINLHINRKKMFIRFSIPDPVTLKAHIKELSSIKEHKE